MNRRHRYTLQAVAAVGALLLAAATPVVAAAMTHPGAASATAGLQSVAHRGDKQYHPDNSVAGIASAVAKGADWIEIDVHYNPSGDTFFLSHDNGCSGPGGSASIDSASYATVVSRCALPELDDVLSTFAAQGYTSFVVELKATSSTRATAPAALVELLGDLGVEDDVWISSLDDMALANVRDTGTTALLMRVRSNTGFFNVSDSYLRETANLGYDGVNVNIWAWNRAKADYAESLGLASVGWAWPTANESTNTTAIEYDLDMYMTDRLDDLHDQHGR